MFIEPEDGAETCLRALKFDNLTSEEFDCTWKACSQYRLMDLKSLPTTTAIMEKWPFYKNPSGFRLVSIFLLLSIILITLNFTDRYGL